MAFKIVRNDITKVEADIIVNTANPKPKCVSGTDLAIYEAAGKEALLAERKTIGPIERGDIAVTGAYNLNAKYIIHTVGPVWIDGNHHELEILERCYRLPLQKAVELGCQSIAFPLISTKNISLLYIHCCSHLQKHFHPARYIKAPVRSHPSKICCLSYHEEPDMLHNIVHQKPYPV